MNPVGAIRQAEPLQQGADSFWRRLFGGLWQSGEQKDEFVKTVGNGADDLAKPTFLGKFGNALRDTFRFKAAIWNVIPDLLFSIPDMVKAAKRSNGFMDAVKNVASVAGKTVISAGGGMLAMAGVTAAVGATLPGWGLFLATTAAYIAGSSIVGWMVGRNKESDGDPIEKFIQQTEHNPEAAQFQAAQAGTGASAFNLNSANGMQSFSPTMAATGASATPSNVQAILQQEMEAASLASIDPAPVSEVSTASSGGGAFVDTNTILQEELAKSGLSMSDLKR